MVYKAHSRQGLKNSGNTGSISEEKKSYSVFMQFLFGSTEREKNLFHKKKQLHI